MNLTSAQQASIREQLERLLQSNPFRNSKRYPALLRYLVDASLNGREAELKERTLALNVFGRDGNYDPSIDPVVRTSAAEVRKRLAQYYQEPGHDAEIRIEVPVGTYTPEFHFPVETEQPQPPAAPKRASWPLIIASAAALALLLILFLAHKQPAASDLFWNPVLASGDRVILCAGGNPLPANPADGYTTGVAWQDAETLARLTAAIYARGKPYQLWREDRATFGDLQQAPAVLIGAFNDNWTLRLMQNMRFGFSNQGGLTWISDNKQPGARGWQVDLTPVLQHRPLDVKQDYAIISRVANSRTGRYTVVVAGLWGYGTEAAGRFLADPKYLEAASHQFPPHWQDKNIEIVIGTEVIGGESGPPRVLDSFFW